MTYNELVSRTQAYARSKSSGTFSSTIIGEFLTEAIDQLRAYSTFKNMPYIVLGGAGLSYLPTEYHYILSLYAASRCFDMDERFFEGTQKRNEFESKLQELIARVNMGDILLYDENGILVTDKTNVIDYIVDEYFGSISTADTEVVI
jgi:hypothetical protein